MRKKGVLSFQSLTGVAMVIVLIGLAVAVGVYTNLEVGKEAAATSVKTIGCEQVTGTDYSANEWESVAYPYIKSVEGVYNISTCTEAQLLKSGNYTVGEKQIMFHVTSGYNTTYLWVNYTTWNTFGDSGEPILILKNATSGVSTISQWLPVIMTVLAAAIIIGVLLTAFRGESGI